MNRRRRLVVAIYAISGAAALVYEVAWTRLLALQLGHTVAAASAVLAAFMGGLAAGASIAGMIPSLSSANRSAALRIYAILELIVAGAALLLPIALGLTIPLLTWAYADGHSPVTLTLVRVTVSLVLVGIPAAAMGATFPVATAAIARVSSDAGLLYTTNTIGAALGAIAAGFWLIPTFGLRATTWVGVALNIAAAAGAWWLSHQDDATPGLATAKPRATSHRPDKSAASIAVVMPGLAAAAAALSGFSALVYEVVWTRLLALVIGPTTYAFATMAASFIAGIAIGSAVGTRIASRTHRPGLWTGAAMAIAGAAATASAWYAATQLPLSVALEVADPSADLSGVLWQEALRVALLLLPMTMALGAAFPLTLAMAGGTETAVARDAARVYAANTFGAIVGALCAGFVLIPWLGLRDSIRAAALLSAIGGGLVLVRSVMALRLVVAHPDTSKGHKSHATPTRPTRSLSTVAAVVAAVVVVVLSPPWDRALLASGAYKYAPYLGGTDLEAVLRAGTLRYYKEGAAATVSVRDLTGTRSLSIDGKVDASNAGDMLTQRLLGLLPALVHGHAKDVAIIGLGSGVTVGSALAAGTVERVDVIEISPEVVEASRFFDKESGHALDQPAVHLIVGDGRSHLLLSKRRYDVIVSEPSNPWMAGVASLFTREFFEAARARLNPNGIVCQWAHTYDIQPDDLRSIVGTFASVFPQGTMWMVGGGDLLLVGAKDGDIAARLTALADGARRPASDAALADVGVAPGTAAFALFSMFSGGPAEMRTFAGAAHIQTDDRTDLEYSAPRGIYGRSRGDNASAIRALGGQRPPAVQAAFDRATAADWTSRGTADLRAQSFATAYDAFHHAAAMNPHDTVALTGLSDAAGGSNRLTDEREWLRGLAHSAPDNPALRIELSRVLAVTGDAGGALDSALAAAQISPDDPRALEQLASVVADSGDGARLTPIADQLVTRFPERADSGYYRATAQFLAGRTAEAVATARQVAAQHPGHSRTQGLLGAACAALGERQCAEAAFTYSIDDNPRDTTGYINAGLFQLQIARPDAAAGYFASALALDPNSVSARNGLAQARELAAKQ